MLLEIDDVHLTYRSGRTPVHAIRGVTLAVDAGMTLAIVGESGCGKSSTARVIAGLERPTAGEVRVNGHDFADAARDRLLRRSVQMVFQHSDQALDRMWTVEQSVAEPLRRMTRLSSPEIRKHVIDALVDVGLDSSYLDRRPRDLSGGQAQRVAIARALISEPKLVVLDEPTASLDQAVRGRTLGLLRTLQREHSLAYIFISHDLASVRSVADRVAVMYLGRVVEEGPTADVFDRPAHPYTRALLAADPPMRPGERWAVEPLQGETPSASLLPSGCAFRARCPIATSTCASVDPQLMEVAAEHTAACVNLPRRM